MFGRNTILTSALTPVTARKQHCFKVSCCLLFLNGLAWPARIGSEHCRFVDCSRARRAVAYEEQIHPHGRSGPQQPARSARLARQFRRTDRCASAVGQLRIHTGRHVCPRHGS
jgi:hypothetical protein